MKYRETLLNLVAENPDLPIIAMVDSDVVAEDCGRWLATFGHCYVGEYAIYNDRYFDDRESFKEEYYDRNDDELCERFGFDPRINSFSFSNGCYSKEQFEVNKKAEEKLEEHLNKIAEENFTKAIIVNIDLP